MRTLIIADAHVGQRQGDAAAMAGLIERAVTSGVGEIVYLGDVCQYLIGLEKLWTGTVRTVVAAWDAARAAGVRIVLVEGNRDFFLDEPDLACHIDASGLRYELSAGGRRFRLAHGDRANRRDLQYRFWAAVSKSLVARLVARSLPRGLAMRIVRSMEARLAATNRRFRYRKPVKELRAEAERAWLEGVEVVLWGHFHTPWRYERDGKVALVVPAWLDFGLSILVEPDGTWGLVEKTLTPAEHVPTMDACPDGRQANPVPS
ncbi:MAG: metallophosphoesterase family protein [Acidobacteria bacterium]|nr:metallophosphoesterase family protein [Acidobacteriota bacterium]